MLKIISLILFKKYIVLYISHTNFVYTHKKLKIHFFQLNDGVWIFLAIAYKSQPARKSS